MTDALAHESGLGRKASDVLRRNDMGGWTRASSGLYPHQWSWDSAFIAIGLSHLNPERACRELERLFEYQWANGKVPHIVFNPDAPPGSYFPDADHWSTAIPIGTPQRTSCLCQPPVHAIAARHIQRVAGQDDGEVQQFLREIYSKLLSWHRYLMTIRDPEDSGLITIFHPWESGTDNSPRWDAPLAEITVENPSPLGRPDLAFVDDPSERPTNPEYDRYLWLVEQIKQSRCNEHFMYDSHPFVVKDVFASAILVAANEALLEIAKTVGAPEEDRAQISAWVRSGRTGLENRWDEQLGLCLDYDVRNDRPLHVRTIAGFAPLVAGSITSERLNGLLKSLYSSHFIGAPDLRWPLPPSTSPEESGFRSRSYWRGPVWPVISWLLWWSLKRMGDEENAAGLRRASLEQLAADDFDEYFEPFTGEALGAENQSWTAAVALDWLAA